QDMRVDRLEIVESGFYDTGNAKVTGSTPAAGSVTGAVQQLGELKPLAEPPATTARVGIGFGLRFRSFRARDGERAIVRSLRNIRDPAIANPTNNTPTRNSVAVSPTTTGRSHWRGYSFDESWEVVPGTWTLEIWQGDRKLLEKSFDIKKASSE